MNISNRLDKHAVAASLVALGAAAAANAAVVTWNINQVVGATTDGLYVNVETGVTYDGGSADTSFPGWDLNPWGSTSLSFFWSGASNGLSQGVRLNTTAGGTISGSTCSSLPVGFVVGASLSGASFGTGSASFTTTSQGRWTFNAINYFGFNFTTAAGQVRYGYGVMQVGANSSVRTLISVSYEDSGGSITVVPAPGAVALLGLAGFTGRRRRC